jgi:protein tyrosine/serine phosphatase
MRLPFVLNRRPPSETPAQPLRRELLKGSLLLPALTVPWLASCGGSSRIGPTPRLASVDNFRDVAGADDPTAYRTAKGQKLRRGIIYRSCALSSPSAADMATLNTLGISTVFDLRTPDEIKAATDHPPAGASETNVNLNGTPDVVYPTLDSADESIAYMQSSYVLFVSDSGVRGRVAKVLHGIATTPGRHLYHCSGGKDRTGWITTTLLSIAGVPQSVIVQDYLLTNVYYQPTILASYQQTLAEYGQAAADATYPLLVADQRYLYAALNQVTADYGTMANYVTKGLGLSAATQTALANLLVP